MLLDGHQICQHLCGMIFIGQSIPDRYTGIFCQFFHDLLSKSSVFNSVIDPSQHSGGVFDTLFFPDLGAFWIQVSGSHAQVMSSYFKGAAGSCTCLFKDQRYIFSS